MKSICIKLLFFILRRILYYEKSNVIIDINLIIRLY